MLYLRTFGGVSLLGAPAARAGAGTQRKPLALLTMVAAAGPLGMTRDQLLAYLWPERDEEHGRPALRQVLHALRRDLAAPALFLPGGDLRLNPEVIGSDIGELNAASAEGDLATIARLYKGPFLDGFHLGEAPEFEHWVERERRRCAIVARDAFEALAARAGRDGDPQAAAAWWRQAAAIEPANGRIALGLMHALAAAGDRGGALQHAKVYEMLVREELEVAPDREVVRFAEELRGQVGQDLVPVSHPASTPKSPEVPQADDPPPPPAATSPDPEPSGPRATPRPGTALLLFLVLAAVVAAVAVLRSPAPASPVLDPAVLAVAPFEVFELDLQEWREGMVDVLSRDLDGAGKLRTVAPRAILRAADTGVSPVALGRATGAGTVVTGTLLRAGPDSVRAIVTLVDTRNDMALDEVIRSDATERMDRLTDSLTLAIVRALAARGVATAAPRRGLRSTSLQAVKLFLRGEHYFRETRWDSARFYYEQAVATDSGLALAYRRLGHVLTWQRVAFDSAASLMLLQAGELNHGLGPHDSLLVRCDSLAAAANATNDALVSWNLGTELFRTATAATVRYPEDAEVWYALGDAAYHFGFGPRVSVPEPEILAALDRTIAADSGFAPAYLHAIEMALTTRGPRAALRYARRYLALNPADGSEGGVRLLTRLLAQPSGGSHELDRLLDTVPADALSLARTILRSWPDSAETALDLSRLLARGRRSSYPLFADTALMRRRLAEQLAFRGRLREAYEVLGVSETGIFADLAVLGAVPADSARLAFRRWQDDRSSLLRLAFPWWAREGDSVSLQRAVAEARASLRRASGGGAFEASYDTAAGLAYLALVRSDTAEALARFIALPDSACVRCYVDRLTRARLLMARGLPRLALTDLEERLLAYSTPFQVVFAAERARAAEALGLDEKAAANREFQAAAWRHADPDRRPR